MSVQFWNYKSKVTLKVIVVILGTAEGSRFDSEKSFSLSEVAEVSSDIRHVYLNASNWCSRCLEQDYLNSGLWHGPFQVSDGWARMHVGFGEL